MTPSPAAIARLNDAFRQAGPFTPGSWLVSRGVSAEGPEFVASAIDQVRRFEAFTEDNDPHGEHDFGAFDLAGRRLFWKIDAYDPDLRYGSPDPANPAVTRRVITIMLAEEY